MIGHGLYRRDDMGFTGNPITDYYLNASNQNRSGTTHSSSGFKAYFAKDKIEKQVQSIKERFQFSHGGKKKRKKKGR